MSKKLSAMVIATNDIYAAIHRFNNTFIKQFEELKEKIVDIRKQALADGEYSNIAALLSDVTAQVGATRNATVITDVMAATKELLDILNKYDGSATLSTRLSVLNQAVDKIDSMSKTISRV